MSLSIWRDITLYCDNCTEGTFGDHHDNAKELRKDAKKEGWTRAIGIDLCPNCTDSENPLR